MSTNMSKEGEENYVFSMTSVCAVKPATVVGHHQNRFWVLFFHKAYKVMPDGRLSADSVQELTTFFSMISFPCVSVSKDETADAAVKTK